MKLAEIKKRFLGGSIKHKDLEDTVFKYIYNSNPQKIKDACDLAARLRCEVI